MGLYLHYQPNASYCIGLMYEGLSARKHVQIISSTRKKMPFWTPSSEAEGFKTLIFLPDNNFLSYRFTCVGYRYQINTGSKLIVQQTGSR